MTKDKFFSPFKFKTIGSKLRSGLLVIFAIFIFNSLFITTMMDNQHRNQKSVSNLIGNSITVFDINRDISELQRMTLVYGQTGNASIYKNIEDTYRKIKQRVKTVLIESDSTSTLNMVKSMVHVINRYGKNIQKLEGQYKSRDIYLKDKLPRLSKLGTNQLKLLMDMQMPILDGINATKKIRKLPQGRSTLIYAMTANAFPEDRVNCIKAGMDGFIAKPVSIQALKYALLAINPKNKSKKAA